MPHHHPLHHRTLSHLRQLQNLRTQNPPRWRLPHPNRRRWLNSQWLITLPMEPNILQNRLQNSRPRHRNNLNHRPLPHPPHHPLQGWLYVHVHANQLWCRWHSGIKPITRTIHVWPANGLELLWVFLVFSSSCQLCGICVCVATGASARVWLLAVYLFGYDSGGDSSDRVVKVPGAMAE